MYNESGFFKYIVKSGDSLYEIAKKFGVSTQDLMQFNSLSSADIYPNHILFIPTKKVTPDIPDYAYKQETYITRDNDTIEGIISRYNLDLKTLMQYNDLKKLKLMGNQKLYIGKDDHIHKVGNYDTLDTILTRYNLSLNDLANFNAREWFRPGASVIIK